VAVVIPFPGRPDDSLEGIDLLTAVDVAIRDLQDIIRRWGEDEARRQASDCCEMLMAAYQTSLRNG
jgi:hypothetical protein